MPDRIAPHLISIEDVKPATDAELTYCIYKLAVAFLQTTVGNWSSKSEAVKAMECAKLELYRRHLAPHEDQAMLRNGDVE